MGKKVPCDLFIIPYPLTYYFSFVSDQFVSSRRIVDGKSTFGAKGTKRQSGVPQEPTFKFSLPDVSTLEWNTK